MGKPSHETLSACFINLGISCLKIFPVLESKWQDQISVVAQTSHVEALDCMKGTSEL